MMLETAVFYAAAVIAVFGAIMMVLQRNPVASVLYLILSLVAQAVLYVQLAAMFVGALLIIIYAGAILVLFLFVIMLLNLRGEKIEQEKSPIPTATKLILSLLFFVELVMIFRQFSTTPTSEYITDAGWQFGDVVPVAELLFTKYLYPFELTSILLLVAIVGAVIMAKREKGEDEGEM